ncbi:DUF1579 domain-containing protein [Acidovorax sp. GBBC 3334]|uniref:DUF1579 domain-containing protein n=1 Tax=Acidovorax sp. GBBC 3334 TaxID=2940496 RepID=UPI0023028924|nr:DUF1579 domain-containing protein [Acidovorax sp. GBBC 3334]MDA8456520.1 DUF1579 domain-containing protein [Acidovorax sp. GBBC 3334]
MQIPEPQEQHRWLHRLEGDWTVESTADMGPGQPPAHGTGTERVRRLGALWVVCEGEGGMPGGGPAHVRMTLGYNPHQQAFVGHWVGSMMTHQWIYRGTLDAGGTVLALETEGPSFTGDGTLVRYRDTITLLGPDERTLASSALQPDGQWKSFMQATYRRVPPAPERA